jgi:DNA-binding MarR family transcriptional regulator
MGERLQVHPTSVTSIVRRLEARGLISRVPHPVDGRAVLAEITPAGRELVERATADLVDAGFALEGIDENQMRQLSELLRPVRAAAGDFEADS